MRKSVLTSGFAITGSYGLSQVNQGPEKKAEKLPREVWVACLSQMGLQAETPQQMTDITLRILQNAMVYQPDVVCLPEVFPTSNILQDLSMSEKLNISADILARFSDFAEANRCYVICPLYTQENNRAYNAAVVMDRDGNTIGEYRKIHLTEDEIENGLTPGPLTPPVFQTDFGTIGIQICFDIEWDDGWAGLKDQKAELIFWPSAFAGGQAVNMKAIQHKYVVASSTRKNTAKLCDITGEVIAQTGIWDRNYFCASVNLEKAFLHTWPYVNRFDEIRKKFGRKVRITTYHEEEWSILESLSQDIRIADIMTEFELKTYDQLMKDSEKAQKLARP